MKKKVKCKLYQREIRYSSNTCCLNKRWVTKYTKLIEHDLRVKRSRDNKEHCERLT